MPYVVEVEVHPRLAELAGHAAKLSARQAESQDMGAEAGSTRHQLVG